MARRAAWLGSMCLGCKPISRIDGLCDVDNPASARVMQKAGLTEEGVLRRWIVHPNISDEPRLFVLRKSQVNARTGF